MTFPATSNMHKLNYVTDTIGWSRIQPSLLGEARGTERAAEIEPSVSVANFDVLAARKLGREQKRKRGEGERRTFSGTLF